MLRSLDGRTPRVADSAFVSEMAYVIGDVEIGEDSGVWPGAVIRADFNRIRIGRNSHIEDNCVLHSGKPLDIGDNCYIGHGVVMHGRRIGNNVVVGNNATILDDAELGDYCLIAAGSVVMRGARIPSGSFVAGAPGEVKGEVSTKQRREWMGHTTVYSDLAKRYKEQGL